MNADPKLSLRQSLAITPSPWGEGRGEKDRRVLQSTVHGEPRFASRIHWDLEPSADSGLPLPKGEGRGEGKGIVRQSTVHNRVNSRLQSTVHGKPHFAFAHTLGP
jgi:hypothetical protein